MHPEVAAPIIIGLCIGLITAVTPFTIWPSVKRCYLWRREYYTRILDYLQYFDRKPSDYVALEALVTVLPAILMYAIFKLPFFVALGLATGAIIPHVYTQRMIRKRDEQFKIQLPDAAMALASSVRSGLALTQAIDEAAHKLPPPVGQEFTLISREYQQGVPLDEVLRSAQERLKSKHFALLSNALIVNRARGGDIVDILERISISLRELHRLEEKLATATARPKFEATVMRIMPIFILSVLYFAEPELVRSMFATVGGIIVVLIAFLMLLVASIMITRILNEDL